MSPARDPPGKERADPTNIGTKSEKQQGGPWERKGWTRHRLKDSNSRMRQTEQQPSGQGKQIGGAMKPPRCALIHSDELEQPAPRGSDTGRRMPGSRPALRAGTALEIRCMKCCTQHSDAPRICLQDDKLVAARMGNDLAAQGNTADKPDDKPAEGVDLVLLLFQPEANTAMRLEIDNRGASPATVHAGGFLPPVPCGLGIMLILDVPDDLLHEILNGDQSVYTTKFIDHKRHVHAPRLHFPEQVLRGH